MDSKNFWLTVAAAGAAILAATYVADTRAKAADLGGSCCADLEERIAELEATTARKGNRKVSLIVSGHISKAMLWHKLDGEETDNRGFDLGDNFNSPSRLTIAGEAKINPSWSAGYLIEFGIGDISGDTTGITLRHNALWIGTPAGKVWLGHTSQATDGIVEINLANSNVAALSLLGSFGLDGVRTTVAKWVSPSMHGLTVSASVNDSEVWDAALRYVTEAGGIRFAGGVGYARLTADDFRISGSASIMHVLTGLYLTGGYGQLEVGGVKVRGYTVQPGIERKWLSIGTTTAFIEFVRGELDGRDVLGFDDLSGVVKVYGGGVVQAVDGLGLDVFATWRRVDIDVKADVIMAGARVRF